MRKHSFALAFSPWRSASLAPAGPHGWVARERVLAIGSWESAPIRRAARQARNEGRLIDLTYGQACRYVIFMDSGHVILSSKDEVLVPTHTGETS